MALTDAQVQAFKEVLLQERARLTDERDAYRTEAQGDTDTEVAGEFGDYDSNDSTDEGANLFNRDRDLAAVETATRLLDKVDRALAKIDEGTYGLSDIDGKPIPIDRLEAVPYAVTTVEQEEAL